MAVALARAGFDLVLTARTMNEGEEREHSSTVAASDTRQLPGSLSTTADAVGAAGGKVLVLPTDLLNRASLRDLVARVDEEWGEIRRSFPAHFGAEAAG